MDELSLLSVVSMFSEKENRIEASRLLAKHFSAEDLLIFIKDVQINIMLPGPGFPQTLANGIIWKNFIDQCQLQETFTQRFVPFPEKGECLQIKGIKVDDSVIVLIGGQPGEEDINRIHKIAPIIIQLLKQEVLVLHNKSIAAIAEKEINKAEKIAIALDKIREKLNLSHVELSKKNKELLRTNNDLDNFIYTASHDLKAPVSNIEGLIYTLEDILRQYAIEETQVVIGLIHNSINRFKNTIMDLTEISKVQNVSYEEELLSFREIIEEVKNTLASQIARSNLDIILDLEVTEVKFSKKNLRSVFYNMISNATKYYAQSRSPILRISSGKDGAFVKLTFEDNGLGIDKFSMKKLFTMFKRFHDHVEGSGIGLYIVKRIIENAGGKIEVQSEQGVGTVFKVYLRA